MIVAAREGEVIVQAAWSPEGSRIGYLRAGLFTPESRMGPAVLESVDLRGGKVSTLLSDWQLLGDIWKSGAFCWSPDAHVIYSHREPAPNAPDSNNLWELRVNSRTGEPAGNPRKITHWSGTALSSVNLSADGKRMAVLKVNSQSDVYVAQLEANGTRMKTPRRLTLDESNDIPGPWMPDSKTVIFSSERNGNLDIFRQAIDQNSAEPLVAGPDDETPKAVTPDGQWLLYIARRQGDSHAPAKLMRVPVSGGSPEFLLDAGTELYDIGCAKHPPSTFCALAKRDPKGLAFSAFDLSTRQSREFAKVENASDWDIFHDGSRIAVLSIGQSKSRVRIVRSSGETEREFIVEQSGIDGIYCSADGKGVYLAVSPQPGVSALYYTDLLGQARMLWQQKGNFGAAVLASPDGRYLSITGVTTTSDAWLLENF